MSGDIVLSSALRSNLLSLQNTQRNIDTTQLRLATGLKVNSALDGPQNFFTAQSLNNRASDFGRLLDGISQSIRTIETANSAVTSLTTLVEQAESIALEAQTELRSSAGFTRIRGDADVEALGTNLADGTIIDADDAGADTDSFDITINDDNGTPVATQTFEIDAGDTVSDIVAAINGNGVINGDTVGTAGVTARVTSSGQIEIQANEEGNVISVEASAADGLTAAGFERLGLGTVTTAEAGGAIGGTSISGNTITSNQLANTALSGVYEASQLLGAGANDAGFLSAGADVDVAITIDGERTLVASTAAGTELTDTNSVQDLIDRINNSGISEISASFDTDSGQIEIQTDGTVGQVQIEYIDNAATTTSFGFGAGAADAALAGGTLGEQITFDGVTTNVDQLEEDYNNVRDQIDQLVEDASYRGVNLLNGDNLTTFFNEDRSNQLTTDGTDFTALGLGLAQGDFTNVDSIQDSISESLAALEDVRRFGSSIANDLAIIQVREQFTEQTINTLKAGADDLTVADQNEEGANLLALQTRQQLAVTSLSLAAQSQQSVLRLF